MYAGYICTWGKSFVWGPSPAQTGDCSGLVGRTETASGTCFSVFSLSQLQKTIKGVRLVVSSR